MRQALLLVFAAFVLAACGAPSSTPATQTDPTAATDDGDAAPSAPAPQPAAGATAAEQTDDGSAPISEDRFRLGVNYTRLSPTQPTSSSPDQVEVAEVFWYGCPHCFAFDPLLRAWQAKKPEYVNFVRIPAVWNDLLKLHARMFYAAQALGKQDEMHAAMFSEIHEKGDPLDSVDKIRDLFGRFGVDAAAFDKTWDSFAVHASLQRADELNRRYRISSVPTIVVNGKYVTDGSMAGSYDNLLELVNELAAAEHAGK